MREGDRRKGGRRERRERERERERAVIYVFSSFFSVHYLLFACGGAYMGAERGTGKRVLSPGREISGASLP